MRSDRLHVRDDLRDVAPYGAPQLDVAVRLNTNETAEPPPEHFLPTVMQRAAHLQLQRYPDRDHVQLREAIARRHGVEPSRIWAANGSNEILQQLLQAYGGPGRRLLTLRPSYSMYPELARNTLTETVVADLGADMQVDTDALLAQIATEDPQIIVLASPNNPVGSLMPFAAIRAVHDASRALVVVDEAYVEFAGDGASALDADNLRAALTMPRLVVVRTFSKAFRLAGLRLGYLVAQPWVIDDVQKVRLPYHLDAIKQIAGMVALEREEEFLDHRRRVIEERERVTASLSRLDGVEVFPSHANFLLVRTPRGDLFERLLEHGVLVRDFSRLPKLTGCIRITIGTAAENDTLLTAMAAVMDTVANHDTGHTP